MLVEVRTENLDISFQLLEFTYARLLKNNNCCCTGLFYEQHVQKQYFMDHASYIFRYNTIQVHSYAAIDAILKKEAKGVAFLIDFDIINGNTTIAEKITFDKTIREIIDRHKEREINVVILKKIQYPFMAALFQKCDLLLKI